MPLEKPSIFIGSSSEGLDIAREVELQLVPVADVNLWTNGIFVLGEGTLESLVNALDRFDFAIMVLSPDDLLETRGQNFTSPRDNVLFELGLFMGRLGRRRTIIMNEEGAQLKLPSDLNGITRATYAKRQINLFLWLYLPHVPRLSMRYVLKENSLLERPLIRAANNSTECRNILGTT